jgi:transposase-like protein
VGGRREYTAAQKAEILSSILQRQATVAEDGRAHGITETTFARWKRQALESIVVGLEVRDRRVDRESARSPSSNAASNG